jgi:hypothetical protein
MKLIVWLLLATTILAGSCKKEEYMEITGLMTDPNQGKPVEGVRVELWTQKLESGIFSANYNLEGFFETGVDGRFAFSLVFKNYTSVKLVFSHSNYFGWETTVNTDVLLNEREHSAEYQILPKAWIEFHVVNTEPFDNSDYFDFRLLNGFTGCEECCRSEKYQFTGMTVDQTVLCRIAGHQDVLIQWSKRKNDEQIFKSELYFIEAFDTTKIEFKY